MIKKSKQMSKLASILGVANENDIHNIVESKDKVYNINNIYIKKYGFNNNLSNHIYISIICI